MSNEIKYICPKCKSENIQRCSILYDLNSNSEIEVNTTLVNKIKPPEFTLNLPENPFKAGGCLEYTFLFFIFVIFLILFICYSNGSYFILLFVSISFISSIN